MKTKANTEAAPINSVAYVSGFPIRGTQRCEDLKVAIEVGNYEEGMGVVIEIPKETTRVKLGDEIYYHLGRRDKRPVFKSRKVGASNKAEAAKIVLAADIKAAMLGNKVNSWRHDQFHAGASVRRS